MKSLRFGWKEFPQAFEAPVCKLRVTLHDDQATTLYVVRHCRADVVPKLVVFEQPITLMEWCASNDVLTAMSGGYDLCHTDTLLGDVWTEGRQHQSEPVEAPWHMIRGSLHISPEGDMQIAARHRLPRHPMGDLLQAGPVLVRDGEPAVVEGVSPEGFSDTSHQFLPDPSIGRCPRVAIGYNDTFLWSVVCDGRSETEAGLSLSELADVMRTIGATQALNLDGGSSAQLVRRGRLLNTSRGPAGAEYLEGYPIRTAIVIEAK